jgi:quinoprotein glucose dehydrogenase
VLLGALDGNLYAIDAKSGTLVSDFGEDGRLDLKRGMVERFEDGKYGLTSPVAVCNDVIVTGAMTSDSNPTGPSGDIRGFDARTGQLLWRFHTVPRPGEFGHETWEGDSWKDRGGVNCWSIMSVDEELGLVYVPLTSPSYDYYGGDRAGANLFGDCVVALDYRTGKRRWHFQTIHHDVWDYDLPAQPNLVTVVRDDREIPALAQITKMGFVFLLNRETGDPLFDIIEKPVPASTIPGEQAWPTQPFPVKPPSFARQSMTLDDITNITSESRDECLEMVEGAYIDGPMYRHLQTRMSVMFPGTNGGANWGGASYDPTSGLLYVNSMDVGHFARMDKRPEGSIVPYRSRRSRYQRFWDSNQYPCQQPPWGTLTAIDLNKGDFRWQVTLGEFDELTELGIPKTGTPNIGGSIVTAGGLVFIAATNDSRFRAFDKDTGEELWVTRLPASGHATPMTFRGRNSGRQYVVIAAGGGNKYNRTYSGKLVAFALPDA